MRHITRLTWHKWARRACVVCCCLRLSAGTSMYALPWFPECNWRDTDGYSGMSGTGELQSYLVVLWEGKGPSKAIRALDYYTVQSCPIRSWACPRS
ncbi:hypothetical protein V8E53_010318 [Lactarius tabidus]